jgi:aspartyl-tRNA(Asn)/glutamyl-tRNA(Gln) amidotransferase subunit A
MALSWTMDKIGPMARTADDCATVYAAIAGPDPADPSTLLARDPAPREPRRRLRLGVFRACMSHAQSEVRANTEAALAVLSDVADLEDVELPDFPWDAAASVIVVCEAASAFEEFILSGESSGLTAPEDRAGLHHALTVPAVDYLRSLRVRRAGGRAFDALFDRFDAIVAPSYPHVAPPVDERFDTYFADAPNQNLGAAGNLLGLPSITVPSGFGERGLPVGLEFLGRAYDEATILAAARAFQSRSNWHTMHPSM